MMVSTEVKCERAAITYDLFNPDLSRVRKNTVRCDFSHLRRDLCVLEMHDFVDNYLRLPPEDLDRLQWNGQQRCLFLRLKDFPTAVQLVEQHSGRHHYPPGRLWSRVFLTLEDTATEVMLYDLSELVTDEQIKEVLDRYGVVFAVEHNKWSRGLRYGGIDSGHRLVQMVVRRSIPSVLYIGNEPAFAMYVGQDEQDTGGSGRSEELFCGGWCVLRRLARWCFGLHR